MKIGYACKLVNVPDTNLKSCTQKNVTEENSLLLIQHNLQCLNAILEYNRANNIHMFRISSDFIPFGSSPINTVQWWDIFADEFAMLGEKAKRYDIRLSMHPGQYTVLNSPSADVVSRAVDDLIYHTRVLDSLGLSSENKIILHIGGAYGDKIEAIERFKNNYILLPSAVKKRLIIENDDKIYTVEEVLGISHALGIPVVFDNLHNAINQSEAEKSEFEWIELCRETWKVHDGMQKIHYSQQAKDKRIGSHSAFISIDEFIHFHSQLNRDNIDIMLEVKDKNLSCVKCVNCTTAQLPISRLEKEWSLYKYSVLEKDPNAYQQIRELLKNKQTPNPIAFYELIDKALLSEENVGTMTNGFLHVWGYFKSLASQKEKEQFFMLLEEYQQKKSDALTVKKNLLRLSKKYSMSYLLDSYYFSI